MPGGHRAEVPEVISALAAFKIAVFKKRKDQDV
jgi:hypothetical protein